jgi:D-inositol-3-phosphate glycosyltransferase
MSERKLRIAILSAHSCPVGDLGAKDTGGMSVYIRELARELGKLGHTVDVYTRIHDPADPLEESMGENARLIHVKAGKKATIRKIDVYRSLHEFIQNLETYWAENRKQYDIVFSHYWISALVGQYLQKKYGIPYISMYHTLGAIKNAIGIGEGESDLRISSERVTIADSRRIVVATEKEKREMELYYTAEPDKVSVIPCGVNMDLFHPYDKEMSRRHLGLGAGKIMLFVGRIDPLKGISRLLESLPLIKDREDVRLIVIGGDSGSKDEIEKLQTQATALGIADKVTFQGIVKQDVLPYYYSAADVCVVPSYYESFGLVPLEALACGTPVVATDVGDLKNIIRQGDTGYIIRDNTPEAIANAVSLVLESASGDAESPLAVRASITRFNWANIADDVAREMYRVVGDCSARTLKPCSSCHQHDG